MTMSGRTRLKRFGSACACAFTAYVGVGGLAGFILARDHAPARGFFAEGALTPPSCWPELGMLGDIGTRCTSAFHDRLWFLALGLPRLVIGLPVVILEFFGDAAGSAVHRHGSYLNLGLPALALLAIAAVEFAIYRTAFSVLKTAAPWSFRGLAPLLALDYSLYIYCF